MVRCGLALVASKKNDSRRPRPGRLSLALGALRAAAAIPAREGGVSVTPALWRATYPSSMKPGYPDESSSAQTSPNSSSALVGYFPKA